MMIGMSCLSFRAILRDLGRLLPISITAAAGGLGFGQLVDARVGSRPPFGAVDITDIGPQGGSFLSLAADTPNPGVLYAGARDTGVFKTTDGGASWTKAGLAGLTVVALALDSNTPGSVYAAAGIDIGDGELGDLKLFRSPDQANTWTRVFPDFPPDCVPISLISDPRIPGTVYLSACGSVFKSTDAGNTWSEMKDGLPPTGPDAFVGALAIDPQDSSRIYVVTHLCDQTGKLPPPACDTHVFTTAGGGNNWSEATSSPLNEALGGPLVIDPQNPSILYLHITWTGGRNGVAKSTDGGKTWTTPTAYLSSGFGSQTLAIDPRDPNTLYASNLGIYKSVDGAQTWTTIYQGPAGFSAVVVDAQAPGVIFGAGSSGIIRSTDGGSNWKSLTTGLHAIQILSIAMDPQHSGTLYAGNYAVADNSGVYKTSNRGGAWDYAAGLESYLTSALVVDPTDSNIVYAGTDVGVYKSVDGGNNWTAMNVGLAPLGQVTDVNVLVTDPQHPNTIYAASPGRHGLFKSTDGAADWRAINSGLPMNGSFPALITALAIDSENSSILYAGTYVGSSVVFKSENAGLTWTASSPDFTASGAKCCAWIAALAVDPASSSVVYVAISTNSFGGSIWRTTDAGASWQNLFASSSASVTALAIDPQNSAKIYAATTDGIVATDDAGVSWTQTRGTPTLISFLGFDPQNPATLYAAGPSGLFALNVGRESRLSFR
jgi:photosystem II stability/assembly factor-like uncharacterized protein